MKFEFAVTLNIQVCGEAEGSADNLNIYTAKKITCSPGVVFLPKDALNGVSYEDQEEIMAYISHHVAKRAEEALRPARAPSEMMPVNKVTDPGKVN